MLSPAAEGGALIDVQGRLVGMAVLGPRRRVLAVPTRQSIASSISFSQKAMFFGDMLAPGCTLFGGYADPVHAAFGRRAWRSGREHRSGWAGGAAGLLEGDIVLTWNAKPVDRCAKSCDPWVGRRRQRCRLGLIRGGAPMGVKVVIGERPVA